MNRAAEKLLPGICGDFAEAVLCGLRGAQKSIPSRFFYDARGSELFERITELEEYYPTRTEIALLDAHADEMAAMAGQGVALVEFGSGSSRKTDRLIEALPMLASYVPIDISETALAGAVTRLRATFPELRVLPVHADFANVPELPRAARTRRKLGFFPGSTIGNLSPGETWQFLCNARSLLGPGCGFIVGVDMKKELDVLLPAYNDREGVTAAFNMNLLVRVNRELEGTFDLDNFVHEAVYNAGEGRIEMHLRSLKAQNVQVLGEPFHFDAGETIHTENSRKYTVAEFQALARSAGWEPARVWTDAKALFSIHYLVP
jgi:dimethylhistidine N-methyltransferase